jgi:hypothetical protein
VQVALLKGLAAVHHKSWAQPARDPGCDPRDQPSHTGPSGLCPRLAQPTCSSWIMLPVSVSQRLTKPPSCEVTSVWLKSVK